MMRRKAKELATPERLDVQPQASGHHSPIDVARRRVAAHQIVPPPRRTDGAPDVRRLAGDHLAVVADVGPSTGATNRREHCRAEPAPLGQPAVEHGVDWIRAARAHPQVFALTSPQALRRVAPTASAGEFRCPAVGSGSKAGIPRQGRRLPPRPLDIVQGKNGARQGLAGRSSMPRQRKTRQQEGPHPHAGELAHFIEREKKRWRPLTANRACCSQHPLR